MTKNTIIGLLVLVALVGFGYYFSKNDKEVQDDNTQAPIVVVNEKPTSTSVQTSTPDAPTVETSKSTGASSTTAALTGTVKPNGASTTYWFEYGESTALGNRSTAQAIGSGYSSIPTPAFITGLHANTLYYYRLSAKNSFATVNGATYSFQTNNNPPPVASAPTTRTLAATDVARSTATLNGQVDPNGSSTSYWYEYGKDTSFGFVTQYQTTNSGTSFMSVPTPISGLEPLTKYYFRLNAQNQFGTVNGSVMNFTTSGPASPSKPTVETSSATNINSTDATFVGRINPNGAETTYWFEYSNDSLLNTLIGSGTPERKLGPGTNTESIQITVNDLKPNTKYYYHLVGKNDYGAVYGKTVSFTTKK